MTPRGFVYVNESSREKDRSISKKSAAVLRMHCNRFSKHSTDGAKIRPVLDTKACIKLMMVLLILVSFPN